MLLAVQQHQLLLLHALLAGHVASLAYKTASILLLRELSLVEHGAVLAFIVGALLVSDCLVDSVPGITLAALWYHDSVLILMEDLLVLVLEQALSCGVRRVSGELSSAL